MAPPKSPFAPARISTDAFPARQRLAKWREFYGRSIANVDIEPIGDEPFHASVTFQSLPGIGLVAGSRSPAHYHLTRQHLVGARDGFGLSVLISGASTTRQLGREIIGRPGTAVVISGTDPSISTMHRPGQFLTIVLPRPELAALVQDLDSAYASQIPAENGALRLLVQYVNALHAAGPLDDPSIAQAVASHIIDLAALALGTSADVAHEAERRGVAAARLQAIKTDIRKNVGDHELSAASVALRHGVSPRYVHKLFERDGTSFSEFVMARRLECALQMLKDPDLATRTISAVAFDCGFSDISYFNRAFRRAYNATPSDIRSAAFRLR
ncbi:AraC family transcriptional regulator [Bradyrhizobium manausense]|uniref:AraC family transcriptional regulator n=1 Tax=Bradyrhizobium TaxID=374 RepID=UPI001BAB65E7|nr:MULTISPECIES: AraC family transcriptional regulator [Bradyrhizobium]MBR0826060.1 AraC family transcriptional regulator [Bradyrhizobium manausense]UVO31907.1 AraC family transcriptional regulator [Bradyrhizobium arachidis]